MDTLEAINYANQCYHNNKINNDDEKLRESLKILIDYADCCYVSEAEETSKKYIKGYIRGQEDAIEDTLDWIEVNFPIGTNVRSTFRTIGEVQDNYEEYIKNKI